MKTINTIANGQILFSAKPQIFEVQIKQNGKVVYRNEAKAGVLNFVESISSIDKNDMTVEGVTQHLAFGHPAVWLFAFDQLKEKMTDLIRSIDFTKAIGFLRSQEAQAFVDKTKSEELNRKEVN